jgi:chemotaxis protein MotB
MLARLSAQISRLSELLSLEKTGKASLEEQVVQLRASLSAAEGERQRLRAGVEAAKNDQVGRGDGDLNSQLDIQKETTARAVAQIEILNTQIGALRRQMAALENALGVSEKKEKDSQLRIADLGQRLNLALAQRAQELSGYRSEFFGKLREILGNRPDIKIVGDRFVFQSELFFDSGSAVLRREGRVELDQLATALLDLDTRIPAEISWVLRVDGHTDIEPIAASQFKSNWELSAARAISVVQYLMSKGVSPKRLVAAGFGEFQPIDPGNTEEAFRRNRRIELKLTER